MSCQENSALIHGYLDGELDLVNSLRAEDHLRECVTCAQTYRILQVLRAAVRGGNLYFRPAGDLAARLHAALFEAEKVGRSMPTLVPKAAERTRCRTWQAVAGLAACLALAAAAVFRFAPGVSTSSRDDLLAQQVLASHVRSLMANHLMDVPSSDQHTLKPWFDGKIDFSPPVRDLSDRGFLLVGGRLDYLEKRAVAALVYQRRKHFINLFVWPSSREAKEKVVMRQGYNMYHWADSGMTYWAVSDLNSTELEQFVRLVRARP